LQQNRPYLESRQINELIEQGFHFGAHSIDHPLYADIDEQEQLRQAKQSIEEITASFNLDYRLFAFPFSDYGVSKRFFEQLSDSVDLTFGTSGLKHDSCMFNKQRIPVESRNYTAQEIIYGEYLYYICKMLLHKNRIKRN
jgi:peptidoglycan/xylan/chitin deacetylase (PgdA/CDA1 family)